MYDARHVCHEYYVHDGNASLLLFLVHNVHDVHPAAALPLAYALGDHDGENVPCLPVSLEPILFSL